MKILFLSTIIALLTFSPVFAQEAPRMDNNTFIQSEEQVEDFGAYASDIIRESIYATQRDVPQTVTEVPDEWEDVGTVDDLIINKDFEVKGVLVDVGGFLGIAAHRVALDIDAIHFVRSENDDEDFYMVVEKTREELENAPEYERRDNDDWWPDW